MLCLKYDVDENDPKLLTNCDSCGRAVHKLVCSGLNASEIKVIDLKGRRTLKFLCEDCQSGLLQVPKILKAIDDMRAEVSALKADMAKNTAINSNANQSTNLSDDHIYREFQERQYRAGNLMIFNLEDHGNDMEDVKHVFSNIMKIPVQPKSATRIGKPNKNGFRPLKVSLHGKDDVQVVIRNSGRLKGQKIFVNPDLTKSQRDIEVSVRNDYRQRVSNGKNNIQIKYHQGVPRIVSKN